MGERRKVVVVLLVGNEANVLTRVVSLFGRRSFNIDSLTVSATNDPKISRITIVSSEEYQNLSQVITQTEKLPVVKRIFTLEKEESLYRELLLIKIKADKTNRTAIKEVADIYRAKIIDLSKESMIIEITGAPEKLDGFLDMLSCYDIVEVCRTGITAMGRGLQNK